MAREIRRAWTADEDVVLRQLWADGKRKRAISHVMGRSESGIASRLRVLGFQPRLGDRENRVEPPPEVERSRNVNADNSFQDAMRAAITSGLERATAGVVKDYRAPKPTRFPTGISATGSFCGSAAQACAESV